MFECAYMCELALGVNDVVRMSKAILVYVIRDYLTAQ